MSEPCDVIRVIADSKIVGTSRGIIENIPIYLILKKFDKFCSNKQEIKGRHHPPPYPPDGNVHIL